MSEFILNPDTESPQPDIDPAGVGWIAEQILLTDTERYAGFNLGKEISRDTGLLDRAEQQLGSFLRQALSRPKSDW